jgi:Spy/CpxP family protein refolding chaperone
MSKLVKGGITMKTKVGIGLAVVVVAAMVLSTTGAYAMGGWGGKKDMEAHFKKMAEELKLTPEQKAQLDKQRGEFMAKTQALREKIKAMRTSLRQELDKPASDKTRIDSLVAELKDVVGEQIRIKVDSIIALKQVLTPEQFARMNELRSEHMRKGKFGQKHGKHGAPGGPDDHDGPPMDML